MTGALSGGCAAARRARKALGLLAAVVAIAALPLSAAESPAAQSAVSGAIEATLVVTRSDDVATLQWKSDLRALYTVMYAARRDAKAAWQPLSGYVRMRGTGETITITDQIPPGETRRYRLHIEPIASHE